MTKKITVNTIKKYKESGEKFSVLTAYDYSTAKYIDEAGIDAVLIGDSLAMTALGYTDIASAVNNCGLMIKNGANAVKIEGYSDYILDVIKRLTQSGIPVMGHLGFTPQFLNTLGGYKIQGKTPEAVEEILNQAKALEKAGVFSIVLEMVPESGAKHITENLTVPTVSCGAGRYCDAQVLVCDDVFGKFSDFKPKFARKYGDMKSLILECAKKYNDDVKSGRFPSDDEVF